MFRPSSFKRDWPARHKTKKAVKTTASVLIPAERVGFEPTVPLRVRLISNQVHSTTLAPLPKSERKDKELR